LAGVLISGVNADFPRESSLTFGLVLIPGYSVAWMEDSDAADMTSETLQTQFETVRHDDDDDDDDDDDALPPVPPRLRIGTIDVSQPFRPT
jgi:hypothetical protein